MGASVRSSVSVVIPWKLRSSVVTIGGSDGLVEEFQCIRDLIGLGVLWYNMLASIMIEGYPYDPYLFSSKVP